MSRIQIEDLIGETTSYDKKESVELNKPKSWCKSISAFANTSGGTLIFGVTDDDTVVGLNDAKSDSEKISEIIKHRITPLPSYSLDFHETDDHKVVIILNVNKGEETPYYYIGDGNMTAYIRSGNQSIPAPTEVMRRLVLHGMNSTFDSLNTDYKASDYSFSKVRERYKVWTGKSLPDGSYESWGMVNENGTLTNAGALMADESPIKYSRVFCTRWDGNTKSGGIMDASDHQEYSGGLISLLNDAETFIKVHSKTMWKKTDNSRLEFPEYVHRSYFEALVNALVHRDYLEYGSEVHVDMFNDRLEISSPGGMVDGTRAQDRNLRTVVSKRRNPVIADIFNRLGYMERQGSGFEKILDGYEKSENFREKKEPEFYSDDSVFIVTLPNLNYPYPDNMNMLDSSETVNKQKEDSLNLTDREKETLQKMEYGVEYSAKEVRTFLGLKSSRTREILNSLIDKGFIRGTSATRNRKFIKVGRTKHDDLEENGENVNELPVKSGESR